MEKTNIVENALSLKKYLFSCIFDDLKEKITRIGKKI